MAAQSSSVDLLAGLADAKFRVHPTKPKIELSGADLWRCFLRSDLVAVIDQDLTHVEDKNDWDDYGMNIRRLNELAAFCRDSLFNGVSMFAILLCCYRSLGNLGFRYNNMSLDMERMKKVTAATSLDKGTINRQTQLLLTAISSGVVLTAEGVELLDQSLDGYIRTKKLGSGSFGRVWQAKRKSDGAQVAIKEIMDSIGTEAELAKVKQEVDNLVRLKSPFVVNLFTSFEDDDAINGETFYIITELCDGDLKKTIDNARVAQQHLPEEKIWRFFACAVAGLFAAHSTQIMHKDLKPDNFLVLGDRVKLADVGLAVDAASASKSHTIGGAAFYRSPEKMKGRYGHKADIWALGCVLYELCTLRYPFGKSPRYLGYDDNIRAAKFAPMAQSATRSADLCSLVDQCLQLASVDRPSIYDLMLHANVRTVLEQLEPEWAHTAMNACETRQGGADVDATVEQEEEEEEMKE